MAIYTLDERSIVGVDRIDGAHREIAHISQTLVTLIDEGASFGEVYNAFQQLAKTMKDHFVAEEDLLNRLDNIPQAVAHIARHKKEHDFFRDALKYAEYKFENNISSEIIPNVVDLIPAQYFEELKDLDVEMAELLAMYVPDAAKTAFDVLSDGC